MTEFTFDQGPAQAENQESGSGTNPAWKEFLDAVPEEAHSQVTPILAKWDKGVQQRFEQVHSKYKPYDSFISSGVDPEQLQIALDVARAMETNPELVWRQLGDHFGFGQQQQQQPSGQGQPNPDEEWGDLPPEVQNRLQGLVKEHEQLREVAGTMAQILLGQQENDQTAKEDEELDALYQGMMQDPIFSALNQEGEAEPYINSLLQAELSPDEAMERFHGFVEHVLKTAGRPGSPRVLGPGGAIPTNSIDVRKATPQQARAIVTQMIADANAAAE